MNKRPAHNMQFQMREIKAEPVDTYETTTPAPTIQQPPGFPMSITGGIPQMGPPLLQAPFFPNPFFVQNMMMQRTMGLQSPNERVYSLLQEDYARWKREFFKTSIMTAQTNSALKRHMCFLTNKETLPTEMLIIESKFEHIRMKIVERLNYDQKVVLYKELIQNLVGLESLVGDKREELEPFELFNWLDGQLIPLEQKQYFHIVLPSYKDMMDLISDTFIRLNLKGIDFSQRQIFISALRHDWSDPKTYIARIEALSPVVRMAPLRILDILERTRTELRNAIREKGYYWSIDTILPVFD